MEFSPLQVLTWPWPMVVLLCHASSMAEHSPLQVLCGATCNPRKQ